ncbi:MAG: T9SS type A sorting domain-containing protein, partial [Chitinophagaceae bacterium]|nr:T9SS type A sorting domain-containing protein [Chitinophagaceae bacterium]
GNGNPNYLDIDADDDGIVDNVEWQTTAGYIPPTGLDSDGDGIDNAYDQTNGFGDAGNTNIPTNTDGTDTPDYIDLDSDNTEQPDNIEAWDTNNDGIINLGENVTGVSSTLDTDGDGLLDIYDNFTTTPKEGSGSIDITEGQTPTAFPNIDTGTTSEMDWRETMTPLPLELISFNGHKVNGGNQLNWVTKDEKDIEKFRLYRSFDGINYHLLTTEDSKAKHNNAGQELTYQFLDTRPNVGVNYYKLSAVEFNLTEEFFNVILLDNSIKGKKYTVRPTIVRTNVIVDINSFSQVQLSLYSLDGKLQFTTDLKADGNGNIQAVVNMTNLPSGLYLINGIDTVSGQRFTEKVIKE